MDLTTFAIAVALIIGLFGFDTVLHPKDVVLEAEVVLPAGPAARVAISEDMLTDILKAEHERISATPSVIARPVIQVGRGDGIAISIAEALAIPSVAYAVQSQLGIKPDYVKLRLFVEEGTTKVLVTGFGGRRFNSFQQEVSQRKDEPVIALAYRAALIAIARVDPYITALNLLQHHADDGDFHDCEALIAHTLGTLPGSPEHAERARFQNLQGIIALFRNDPAGAARLFESAMSSDPGNPVAVLNASFAHMAANQDTEALAHIEALLDRAPPADPVLLGTAYTTLAAARMGLGDLDGAETAIRTSVEAYPNSSTAYGLWSELKRLQGDAAGAETMRHRAAAATIYFENYAEIAALYFRMAWHAGEPIMRSPFTNPPALNMRGPAKQN
jgi:tetratricopeptide (TPR) repeat protein